MINFFQAWVLLLMYMKLSGQIDWSWWWVWSPAILQISLGAISSMIARRIQQKAIEEAAKREKLKAFKKP